MKNAKSSSAVGFSPAATPANPNGLGQKFKRWVRAHPKAVDRTVDGVETALFIWLVYERIREPGTVAGWELLVWVLALIFSLALDFVNKEEIESETGLRCLWTFLGWLFFMMTAKSAQFEDTTSALIVWKFVFLCLGQPARHLVKWIFKQIRTVF